MEEGQQEDLEEREEGLEDRRYVGKARKKDTEALLIPKTTRQFPIQPKRLVKKQQPPLLHPKAPPASPH